MAENDSKEQPVVEKSRKRLLGVLATLVLVAGAGVVGTILGPRLLGQGATEEEPEPSAQPTDKEGAEAEGEKAPNPMAFQPIIVELKDGIGKEEFERLMPRGREAAIGYLRGKFFDELTDPTQFEVITKELNERITKAMGEKNAKRIVITDFVAQ